MSAARAGEHVGRQVRIAEHAAPDTDREVVEHFLLNRCLAQPKTGKPASSGHPAQPFTPPPTLRGGWPRQTAEGAAPLYVTFGHCVRAGRLELPHPFGHWDLNPATPIFSVATRSSSSALISMFAGRPSTTPGRRAAVVLSSVSNSLARRAEVACAPTGVDTGACWRGNGGRLLVRSPHGSERRSDEVLCICDDGVTKFERWCSPARKPCSCHRWGAALVR